MRKIAIFFLLFSAAASSQEYKNTFKVNLAAGATKIFAAQYEYRLKPRISFNQTFFFRPKTSIIFGHELDQLAKKRGVGLTGVDFQYIFLNEAKIGVKGYSPELRFYVGKNKNKSFVGLFGQYENFDTSIPASLLIRYKETDVEVKAPVNFEIKTLSAGLLIGHQFRFGERVSLDLVLFGPHFGKANNVYAVVEDSLLDRLSADEKERLKGNVIERFRLSESNYSVFVSGQKAEIQSVRKIPYLGFRAFGLNLGYSF